MRAFVLSLCFVSACQSGDSSTTPVWVPLDLAVGVGDSSTGTVDQLGHVNDLGGTVSDLPATGADAVTTFDLASGANDLISVAGDLRSVRPVDLATPAPDLTTIQTGPRPCTTPGAQDTCVTGQVCYAFGAGDSCTDRCAWPGSSTDCPAGALCAPIFDANHLYLGANACVYDATDLAPGASCDLRSTTAFCRPDSHCDAPTGDTTSCTPFCVATAGAAPCPGSEVCVPFTDEPDQLGRCLLVAAPAAATAYGAFPTPPQVVSAGGAVLTAPKVQPISWAGTVDPMAADMMAFLDELSRTTYWSQVTSEYGVGALTVLPIVTIAGPAPPSIADGTLKQILADSTSGPVPAFGAADPETIYLFLIPPGTIVSANGSGCTNFDGYHSEDDLGATPLAYAVGCACPGFDGPAYTDLQQRTVAISHELVEAATDPFVIGNEAFGLNDNNHLVWTLTAGGEVADMCEFNTDSYVVPSGNQYMVQRIWSNSAALQGLNPCVPHTTSDPYFNSFPLLPQTVSFTEGSFSGSTSGITIPIGQTQVVDLQLVSGAATAGPWIVSVYDWGSVQGQTPNLDLSLDESYGENGGTVHLTITPRTFNAALGGEAFVIFSDLGGQENVSMGFVGN